jgi:hypothetical protein
MNLAFCYAAKTMIEVRNGLDHNFESFYSCIAHSD